MNALRSENVQSIVAMWMRLNTGVIPAPGIIAGSRACLRSIPGGKCYGAQERQQMRSHARAWERCM